MAQTTTNHLRNSLASLYCSATSSNKLATKNLLTRNRRQAAGLLSRFQKFIELFVLIRFHILGIEIVFSKTKLAIAKLVDQLF